MSYNAMSCHESGMYMKWNASLLRWRMSKVDFQTCSRPLPTSSTVSGCDRRVVKIPYKVWMRMEPSNAWLKNNGSLATVVAKFEARYEGTCTP